MKKKLIAVSLITAMVICNSMTVWAADTWSGNGTSQTYTKGTENNADDTDGTSLGTKNVTATFKKELETTYSVTISWEDLSYSYDYDLSWDDTHYTIGAEDIYKFGWSASSGNNGNVVSVSNNSDKNVTATFSFTQDKTFIKNDGIQGVFAESHNGLFDNDNMTVYGTVDSKSYTLYSAASVIPEGGVREEDVYVGIYGAPTEVVSTQGLSNLKIGTVTITLTGN